MSHHSNNTLGLLQRLRRALTRAPLSWRALAGAATLGVLLFAPAALIAHELQDARTWNQSAPQGKHVKPACQICTLYAAFEHALPASDTTVVVPADYGYSLPSARHRFVPALLTAFRSRAPPLHSSHA
jgi:hypothetical protein